MRNISILSLICIGALLVQMGFPQEPTRKPLNPETVEAQIKSLYVQDAVWRKIPWKTTLLEGLHESRAKNKPAILWIFIDRPVDDERC